VIASKHLLLALSLLAVCSVAATAGQQDASILGQVTDESGGVLPGVTVTATSPSLQVHEIAVVTDEHGEYRLTPLPIGTYDVVYSLQGFQVVRREGLRLTTGFSAKVDVTLKVGGVEESITVSGASPVVDVKSTAASTQLTRETLELTPTSRNGLIALMAQAPGVRPNLDVGGNSITSVPSFHAFGQDGESWQTIEGIVTMSPKSGTQSGNYWDYSSLEETRVQTVGSDADIPNRGIYMGLIVKSGGNDFHGSGYWAQTNKNFQSNNIDADLASKGITSGNPVNQRRDVSGDLGGRIVRDKLWFYYATRRRDENEGIVNAYKPDGSPATLTNFQVFSTEKVSWQANRSNRVVGFNEFSRKDLETGASQFVPWESRVNDSLKLFASKVEWQSTPTNTLIFDLQFGRWNWTDHYVGSVDSVATVDQLTQLASGATTRDGESPIEYRNQAKGSMSWYKPDLLHGNHQIKTGFEYAASRADRPYMARAAGDYQLVYRNSVPFQVAIYNDPTTPYDLMHYLGLYVTDAWTVTPKLTLNLGVRYAHDNGFVPDQCRDAAVGPASAYVPAACFSQIQFNVWNPVTPRLHAAYDVSGNGHTVVKGGWGRFAHMRAVDELQQANPNTATQTSFTWHDLNNDRLYEPGEVNLNLNGGDFVSTNLRGGGAPANGLMNPNETEPYTDEYFGSLEHELMTDLAVRGTVIYSRLLNQYRLANIKRPYDVYNLPVTNMDPGKDGKLGTADDPGTSVTYYDYPAAYAGAAFQQSMLVNDDRADSTYKSYEIAVSRRYANGWQFQGSFSGTKKNSPLTPNSIGANGATLSINTYDPNAEINRADMTWEWLGRLSGAYRTKWDVLVSANYERRSGSATARTVSFTGGKQIPSITLNVEPIGSIRLPDINLLDVRGEKNFRIAGNQKIAVRLNIYNVLNINTVTGQTVLSGASFGKPTAIIAPRILEFSASYSF
jgi:carboxypeptidase family protein/TonB-dependent receptor-like protein